MDVLRYARCIWVHVILGVILFQIRHSAVAAQVSPVQLDLHLIGYDNHHGTLWNGEACDYVFRPECDPQLTLCLGPQSSADLDFNIATCPYLLVAFDRRTDKNNLIFGSNIEPAFNNPHTVQILEWQGAVRISIASYDDDKAFGKELVDLLSYVITGSPTSYEERMWSTETVIYGMRKQHKTALVFKYRIYCGTDARPVASGCSAKSSHVDTTTASLSNVTTDPTTSHIVHTFDPSNPGTSTITSQLLQKYLLYATGLLILLAVAASLGSILCRRKCKTNRSCDLQEDGIYEEIDDDISSATFDVSMYAPGSDIHVNFENYSTVGTVYDQLHRAASASMQYAQLPLPPVPDDTTAASGASQQKGRCRPPCSAAYTRCCGQSSLNNQNTTHDVLLAQEHIHERHSEVPFDEEVLNCPGTQAVDHRASESSESEDEEEYVFDGNNIRIRGSTSEHKREVVLNKSRNNETMGDIL